MRHGSRALLTAGAAQAMQGDRERLLAAGFDGYISKPVDVVELLDTVRRHCDIAAHGGRMSRVASV